MNWGIFPKDIWGIILLFSGPKTLENVLRLNRYFYFYCKEELLKSLKRYHNISLDLNFKQLIFILNKKELKNEFYAFGKTKTFYPLFITALYHGGYLYFENRIIHFINNDTDNYISYFGNDIIFKENMIIKFQKEGLKDKIGSTINLMNEFFFMELKKDQNYHLKLTITFIYNNKCKIFTLRKAIKTPSIMPDLNWNLKEFLEIPITNSQWVSMMRDFCIIISCKENDIEFSSWNSYIHKHYTSEIIKYKKGSYKIQARFYKEIYDSIHPETKLAIRFQDESSKTGILKKYTIFQIKMNEYLFSYNIF